MNVKPKGDVSMEKELREGRVVFGLSHYCPSDGVMVQHGVESFTLFIE